MRGSNKGGGLVVIAVAFSLGILAAVFLPNILIIVLLILMLLGLCALMLR